MTDQEMTFTATVVGSMAILNIKQLVASRKELPPVMQAQRDDTNMIIVLSQS